MDRIDAFNILMLLILCLNCFKKDYVLIEIERKYLLHILKIFSSYFYSVLQNKLFISSSNKYFQTIFVNQYLYINQRVEVQFRLYTVNGEPWTYFPGC